MLSGISVVIPCYNGAATVVRAIDSALSQGASLRSVIVVDDGSTDDTQAVLQRLRAHVRVTRVPNGGAARARNVGLSQVTTPYVMFLDADDTLEGPILAGAFEAAQTERADIVFSAMALRYPDRADAVRQPVDRNAADIFDGWFDGGWIGTCSTVWCTGFVREIGGWDETLRTGDDGELVLRALMRGAKVGINRDGCGVYHRGRPGSLSNAGGITREKLADQIDLIDSVCQEARRIGWEDRLGRSYDALYFLGRLAFQAGHADLGRRALSLRRLAGQRGHRGTLAHRIASTAVGLPLKVRLFGS